MSHPQRPPVERLQVSLNLPVERHVLAFSQSGACPLPCSSDGSWPPATAANREDRAYYTREAQPQRTRLKRPHAIHAHGKGSATRSRVFDRVKHSKALALASCTVSRKHRPSLHRPSLLASAGASQRRACLFSSPRDCTRTRCNHRCFCPTCFCAFANRAEHARTDTRRGKRARRRTALFFLAYFWLRRNFGSICGWSIHQDAAQAMHELPRKALRLQRHFPPHSCEHQCSVLLSCRR
jgi:hypothetical protein